MVYELTFKDGKKAVVVCPEPAPDSENARCFKQMFGDRLAKITRKGTKRRD